MRYGRQLTGREYAAAQKCWAAGQLTEQEITLPLARALVKSGRGFTLTTSRVPGQPITKWVLK